MLHQVRVALRPHLTNPRRFPPLLFIGLPARTNGAGAVAAADLATERPLNADQMPDIKDMFAERLKLQQRVMEVLAPIVREQVAIEASAEAAMRQTYVSRDVGKD